MKFRIMMVALVAAAVCALSGTASAASDSVNYRWSSTARWAFINDWADWADRRGYRYPNLYADCLQKVAARMYPSYAAFMRDTSNRYSRSAGVMNCILEYGDKWYDW